MTAFRKPLAFAALLAIMLVGCTGGRTTAVVTDRPEQTEPPTPTPEPVEEPVAEPDPLADVEIGRFDTGKMWTFDNPPIDYFEQTYGFRPDSVWFAHARLGALRIPGCSASFVSPSGLILTNHHCARESISEVSKEGEQLLDEGFYASSLEDERKVAEMYAEQLISTEDVTDEVYDLEGDPDDVVAVRRRRADQIEQRMDREAKAQDSLLTVQIVELYNGGQYSAYTFRKYDDLRLVFAPHLTIGAFGGDPDNFTYPRYSLDFSFFRAYAADDTPLKSDHYFRWSDDGAQEGEAVFVVGNPGTTNRLNTVAQLEFMRDYTLPHALDALRTRMEILSEYMDAHPDQTREFDLRNAYHQLSNQVKKHEGELAGLRDPALIARRQKAENELLERIAEVDTLQEEYGNVITEIARLQRSKEATADQSGAFIFFAQPSIDSHVLVRAVYGYIISLMRQRGAPQSNIRELREEVEAIEDWPRELEEEMLAARLREVGKYLGSSDPTVNRILQGRTPEQVSERIVSETALADSSSFMELLEEGYLESGDPSVLLAEALTPLYFSMQQQISGLESREQELNAELARARFALHGTQIPPDATFSLRIADGIVDGYPYNGTRAPAHTTFYGMYNHYYSYGGEGTEWDLPDSWLTPPPSFERSTAVNLVTTNDITGGNSGSPLLDQDLEIVGVAFDSNIDALQNTYIYLDERGRAVAVDSRGILEALDDMYDADRIVLELREGMTAATEEEADEQSD